MILLARAWVGGWDCWTVGFPIGDFAESLNVLPGGGGAASSSSSRPVPRLDIDLNVPPQEHSIHVGEAHPDPDLDPHPAGGANPKNPRIDLEPPRQQPEADSNESEQ